jgi:hypothetical protein
MNTMSQNLDVGSSQSFEMPLASVELIKLYAFNLPRLFTIGESNFNFPSFCEMINQINCNDNQTINIQVIFLHLFIILSSLIE